MQWQGIKIHVVFVSLCLALAAFFWAYWLYNSLNFKEPLKKALDASIVVKEYRIEGTRAGIYRITVTMKETDNLMLAYRQVYESTREVMGNHQFVIKLVDNRDERLEDLYYRGQFAIQEALIRGNFRDMAVVLNESAERAGVKSAVFIDENNIYWQMSHGEYYLYEVIPRPALPGSIPGDTAEGRG